MAKKARLGLYLADVEIKKQIKIAAAKRGMSTTAYCAEAIEERLRREGEMGDKIDRTKIALLSRMDKLKKAIGPVGKRAAELVKEGRRR